MGEEDRVRFAAEQNRGKGRGPRPLRRPFVAMPAPWVGYWPLLFRPEDPSVGRAST